MNTRLDFDPQLCRPQRFAPVPVNATEQQALRSREISLVREISTIQNELRAVRQQLAKAA